MSADLQVQVLDDIEALATAKRFRECLASEPVRWRRWLTLVASSEHAAFIRSTQSLAMWTDNVRELIAQITATQDAMMDYIYAGPENAVYKSEKIAEEAAIVYSNRTTWQQAPLMGGLATGLNVLLACATIRQSFDSLSYFPFD